MTQNPGFNTSCIRCGRILVIDPMPMQRMPYYGGQPYPGKLQAISIVQTVIGAIEILLGIFWLFYTLLIGLATFGIGLLLLPLPFILLTVGIISLVAGIRGLNKNFRKKLSFGIAIAQLVLLLGCDILSFAAGLTALILLSQDDTKAYLASVGQG